MVGGGHERTGEVVKGDHQNGGPRVTIDKTAVVLDEAGNENDIAGGEPTPAAPRGMTRATWRF